MARHALDLTSRAASWDKLCQEWNNELVISVVMRIIMRIGLEQEKHRIDPGEDNSLLPLPSPSKLNNLRKLVQLAFQKGLSDGIEMRRERERLGDDEWKNVRRVLLICLHESLRERMKIPCSDEFSIIDRTWPKFVGKIRRLAERKRT